MGGLLVMEPKIGVALGAGAAKGLAHIGVLRAFEEEEIPIDYLAGTSIGSIIGGFYAAGVNLHMLERLAVHLDWEHLTDLTVSRMGLIAGNKLKEFFKLLTKQQEFADLDVPFAAVAADVEVGKEVVLEEGLVADALRASMSIPGVYVPYRLEGRKLVDGAVLNRVPISVIKSMGADVIIGVDVSHDIKTHEQVNNIFEVIINSIDIMQQEIAHHKKLDADILVVPKLGHISPRGLDRAQETIELGYQAAEDKIPAIKELIKQQQLATS